MLHKYTYCTLHIIEIRAVENRWFCKKKNLGFLLKKKYILMSGQKLNKLSCWTSMATPSLSYNLNWICRTNEKGERPPILQNGGCNIIFSIVVKTNMAWKKTRTIIVHRSEDVIFSARTNKMLQLSLSIYLFIYQSMYQYLFICTYLYHKNRGLVISVHS